ncbi:2-phosphosulfolactate phosphatase [Hydrogenispora ethanolica]|uniref:Probable 2-phosphosulfolactate phosphatase n=1 Tax=Hydrogenispora ethanolica TaxID=1082276 RepID=A0A4R1SA92_HYDET|nr:2-phosphosulfolactate phosphatase [Hydrogenispora ethanolica]TCL76371.1 2-phosphosulfolactate phosphatase [Hydrogenispora ethanolica]
MQADVTLALPQLSGNTEINNKITVVIDALRATSTIVTALHHQAIEVIPVVEPAEAVELAKNIGAQECITGGERRGLRIDGFELGNSPLEYTEERIAGKKIILSTTNGTKAIKLASQGAAEVLIGSFLNVQAVIEYLSQAGRDLVIACAGRGNWGLSLEDLACAGWIIRGLIDAGLEPGLTDAAKTALYAQREARSIGLEKFFRQTDNGRNLIEVGLEQDLAACADLNSMPLLPRYSNGRVAVE